MSHPAPALLWFRHDLRLNDQPALAAAVAGGRPVVPLFLLDDASDGQWAYGAASRWWLHHSLASLARDFAARGSALVLRRGEASSIVPALARETGASEVICGVPAEPARRDADARVAEALAARGIGFRALRTATLFDPDTIRTQAGGVFGVYTPFSRACFATGGPPDPLPAPDRIVRPAAGLPASDRLDEWRLLPTKPDWAGEIHATWEPGEAGAAERLARFLKLGLGAYGERRNLPGMEGTSMLSPHLHWGEMSPGQVWHAAVSARIEGPGTETLLKEILWREFSAYLLWHHRTLPEAPLRPEFARMPWRRDDVALGAWQRGRTGLPIVDAGMRQLWRIGWMHNRVRMICASLLIKHLLIDWREGAAWFWDTLVDADLASNSASWQWVAGSGADAAPFFRIFNPVLQGLKFDPAGDYVRRWVPELEKLAPEHIHAPWQAPERVLAAAGVRLGDTYPRPIVDLAEGRARALAALAAIGRGAAG